MRCLAITLILAATAAAAQDLPPPRATERAPVVLDGRVLFEVGESGAWSPAERAAEINRTLRLALAGSEPVHLELAEYDGLPTIRMGEWHLISITDGDVLPGMEPGEQAQRWLQRVEAALRRGRDERAPAHLLAAAGFGVVVLLSAAVLHWLLWRAGRRLPLLLGRGLRLPLRSPLGGPPAWQTAIQLGCIALQAVLWLVALLALGERFPTTRHWRFEAARGLAAALRAPLFTASDRSYAAADLLWPVAAVLGLWVTVGVATRLISQRLARATGASRGALQPVATLVRYALICIGVPIILQVAGLNLSSLAILASVLGVGIGFGLQSIANNFVSGLIITFERPVKPGDFVTLGALQGTVERIGGRSTVIRTLDRVSIIVPNSRLLESEVVNWSYGDPRTRVHVPIGVAYGSDVGRVRTALLEAAHGHPRVLREPRPEVRMSGFGDSSLDFELLAWTADPPEMARLRSDLNFQIEANLRRHGIEVPFPQRTLHLPPAEVDEIVARLRGEARPAAAVPAAAPAPAEPAVAEPPWREADVAALVERMRAPGGLAIADRRHLLQVYPRCFVGNEAVDWLVRMRDLSRDEAVRLGQLLVERRIIHHVLDEHPFRDGNFYYRFCADENGAAVEGTGA